MDPDITEINRIQDQELTSYYAKRIIQIETIHTHYQYERYPEYSEKIRKFDIRHDDVLVASFPKSGTTWMLELVWLLQNNLDFEGAKAPAASRSPFIEHCVFLDWDRIEADTNVVHPQYIKDSIEFSKKLSSPRVLKTHLPFCLLPEQIQNRSKLIKLIYLIRNPMDVCISFAHHGRSFIGWSANAENYAKVLMADKGPCGPYWIHVFEYWEKRKSLDILFVRYEDMKKNLSIVIQDVATFLGKTITPEQIPILLDHLSFDSMKKNISVNNEAIAAIRKKCNLRNEEGSFIRSGTVGKYKEELSPGTIAKFQAWIKKNVHGTDFNGHFDYSAYYQ